MATKKLQVLGSLVTDISASATVDNNVGEPTVSIDVTNSGGARTLAFNFKNLKGEAGKDGIDGVDGKDGTNGIDGVDGKDGNDGTDGYTPVKGVDYYTEADRDELISIVLNSVPSVYPNGSRWSVSNLNDLVCTFTDVKYADGVWVATSDNGIYYSFVGIDDVTDPYCSGRYWLHSNVYVSFNCVYNANGLWVAGGPNGIYYSVDGVNWVNSEAPGGVVDVVYADEYWFAARDGSYGGLFISSNGKSWMGIGLTNTTYPQATFVRYGNGVYIAGTINNGLHFSYGGSTWSNTNYSIANFYDAYYAKGMWVSTASGGIFYSTNGTSWVWAETPSDHRSDDFRGVYCADGTWVVGSGGANAGLFYSKDGKTFYHSNVTTGSFKTIRNANGMWVAGDDNGGGLYYSFDGMVWMQSNLTSGSFAAVHNAGGLWVAGGNSALYYSVSWMKPAGGI